MSELNNNSLIDSDAKTKIISDLRNVLNNNKVMLNSLNDQDIDNEEIFNLFKKLCEILLKSI